jgi:V/A-type H+-transporting ATPase subunit D
MEQTSATRMTLLSRKGQLSLAEQGSGLLKAKREALLKELMALVEPLIASRCALTRHLSQAIRGLTFAEALDGSHALHSLAQARSTDVHVELDEQKVWGVRIPELIVSERDQRAQPTWASARALEAEEDFEELVAEILRLAPLQIRVQRLGTEVKSTSRRVNALDQVLIPFLEREIKTISQALEEIEREDAFRLRRIKAKRERKQAQGVHP